MGKFEQLTKYIPLVKNGNIGEWAIDTNNDGTPEHPIQMPYVNYSEMVNAFREDLFRYCELHPELEHTKYIETLAASGLEWSGESMKAADVSALEPKCVIALLVGAVRAERFWEILFQFCIESRKEQLRRALCSSCFLAIVPMVVNYQQT